MSLDRSVRYLTSLGEASTSRVLNLLAIASHNQDNPEYKSNPLFLSPVINTSIFVKHKVRPHEDYLFRGPVSVATKIIVPFDRNDLGLGGRSFFFGQKGFSDALRDVGRYREGGIERDLEVMKLVNQVPSLDPFLLREYLKLHHVNVPNCYFEISPSDREKMYAFAAKNMLPFIQLATGGTVGKSDALTDRFVQALLSSESAEKLEPLRTTLVLDGKEFREGVFSWRGFLYYKWSLHNFLPDIGLVIEELQRFRPAGTPAPDQLEHLRGSRKRIAECVRVTGIEVGRILKVYDEAYSGLIDRGDPRGFREFLLSAPHMFIELGERMGALSHVTTFWRHRFQRKGATRPDADELMAIFEDFEAGFAPITQAALAKIA